MKVIYGTGPVAKRFPDAVVAIGVFDAVHRGHQKVIGRAVAEARRLGVRSVVVTFDPHPVFVLYPKMFRGYVLSLEHRLRMIEACGADICCVIPFSKSFSKMKAEDFVSKILVERLHARKVIVGEDFYFGHDRSGSFSFLKEQGSLHGFSVEKVSVLKINKINIKTNLIKSLIAQGDIRKLRRFLGRDYTMWGEVERGDARGRRLGYPTANLKKENVVILPPGIYCVRVFWGKKEKDGLFYIGTRPTFNKAQNDVSLELHVLNYQGNLYGKKIQVRFLKKIRDDRRFPDEKSLVRQIARDIKTARRFLSKTSRAATSF